MAKFTVTTGTVNNSVTIEPGESLEIPLKWENYDGSERDMSGAIITVSIYQPTDYTRANPTDFVQADPYVLSVPASYTATLSTGTYHMEIWEERASADPAAPYESAGNCKLVVKR